LHLRGLRDRWRTGTIGFGDVKTRVAAWIVTLPDGGTLRYAAAGRDFRIPAFIAWGDRAGVLGYG
jgi:hypothetical protein